MAARLLRLKASLPLRLPAVRHMHRSQVLAYPEKDSQDREDMNTSKNEGGSLSGSNNAVAHESAAFDPHDTNPESQKERTHKA
jgi:hypothetical protein